MPCSTVPCRWVKAWEGCCAAGRKAAQVVPKGRLVPHNSRPSFSNVDEEVVDHCQGCRPPHGPSAGHCRGVGATLLPQGSPPPSGACGASLVAFLLVRWHFTCPAQVPLRLGHPRRKLCSESFGSLWGQAESRGLRHERGGVWLWCPLLGGRTKHPPTQVGFVGVRELVGHRRRREGLEPKERSWREGLVHGG